MHNGELKAIYSILACFYCTFGLIQKYQKIKTKKSFAPQACRTPRFFVGPALFALLNIILRFYLILS